MSNSPKCSFTKLDPKRSKSCKLSRSLNLKAASTSKNLNWQSKLQGREIYLPIDNRCFKSHYTWCGDKDEAYNHIPVPYGPGINGQY